VASINQRRNFLKATLLASPASASERQAKARAIPWFRKAEDPRRTLLTDTAAFDETHGLFNGFNPAPPEATLTCDFSATR
jgi:hypothetical protein